MMNNPQFGAPAQASGGQTLFSPTTRVLLCQNCGAPVDAAVGGGVVQCRYCGAQSQIRARNETLVAQAKGPPISEYERLTRLRAQDGRPMMPPPSLAALMPNGDIPDWKISEVLAVWQSTRRELESSDNFDAAERLLFLSLALANKFGVQQDLLRQRAMFESALDAMSLPRHRQIVRCSLARCAAKMGDLAGAEAWLAPCDPTSDDLECDSEYRCSRALIDTFSGNYQRVLQVLGNTAQEVPIQDAMDDLSIVFRANAWEKLGQLPTAVAQLKERMSQGPQVRNVLAQIMSVYGRWNLCAQSFPMADSQHSSVAAGQAAQMSGGMLAYVFLPLGAMFVLIAAGCLAGVVYAFLSDSLEWAMGPGICALVMGPLGLAFIGGGLKARAAGKRAERLRLYGTRATARIQGVSATGLLVNNVPQVAVQLMVELPGQMPYPVVTKLLLSNPQVLQHGGQVAVRVDPQDRSSVLIETD
jgi:DNA-directed RNA polymerase subunit RPC12/RpoP